MKNALFILLILASFTVKGQTEKGKKFIGGNFSLSHSEQGSIFSNQKQNSFNINPSLGYFIKNNFAIGASINYGYSAGRGNQIGYSNMGQYSRNEKAHNYICGIGGFARYYKSISSNLFFLLKGEISFSHSNNLSTFITTYQSDTIPHSGGSSNNFSDRINLSISPGLVYFISPKFGIESFFGSLYSSYSRQSLQHFNNYGLNLNLSTFYLGLNYYF